MDKKGNLIENIGNEVIGAITLGLSVIVFVIILGTLGETTGQTELTKNMINILLIILGIGIPIGIISIIKFLMDNYD